MKRPVALPPIAELARPELKLAGKLFPSCNAVPCFLIYPCVRCDAAYVKKQCDPKHRCKNKGSAFVGEWIFLLLQMDQHTHTRQIN